MSASSAMLLIASREFKLLRRRRAAWGALVLLAVVAWLPPLLLPLRSGVVGLASFSEMVLLALALGAIILPLFALLTGADLLAGEIEDRTLVPLLTLPISRTVCFAGKCLGRAALLGGAYGVAFGSVSGAVALVRGTTGWEDYLMLVAGGLLLCLSCGGIGVALGVSPGGRIRAFASALVAWLVLAFALDAVLLAVVVVLAPAPPEQVGVHGHGELTAPRHSLPIHDPHGNHTGPSDSEEFSEITSPAWLMTLDPVALFRLSALTAGPRLRERLAVALPGTGDGAAWFALALGWLIWLVLPPIIALWRFRRATLR